MTTSSACRVSSVRRPGALELVWVAGHRCLLLLLYAPAVSPRGMSAGEAMTDEEILEMIQAADMDKDGMINEEEFWRIMKKGLAC